MKAEQGIELLNSIQLQMNSVERAKFNEMVLKQVENHKMKVNRCLAKLLKKHAKGQKLKINNI